MVSFSGDVELLLYKLLLRQTKDTVPCNEPNFNCALGPS
jgi:hypothetical protein